MDTDRETKTKRERENIKRGGRKRVDEKFRC